MTEKEMELKILDLQAQIDLLAGLLEGLKNSSH